MKIHTLDTGYFKLDGGAMFGVVPKQIWNKLNPADENNLCTWALRCLLVEDTNRLILVDTGIGDKQDESFFKHYYLHGDGSLFKAIRNLGYDSEDITDVFLTHLHFDHCGGALRKDESGEIVPTFPKARHWTNKGHWEWATHPNAREKASFLKENIMPLANVPGGLSYIEDRHSRPFGQNFEIIEVNGHTERQMIPLITTESGKRYLFCGDLMPSSAHVPMAYIMGYDMRPLITLREKEALLARCIKGNIDLIFEHDPVYETCALEQTEKGIRPINLGNFQVG